MTFREFFKQRNGVPCELVTDPSLRWMDTVKATLVDYVEQAASTSSHWGRAVTEIIDRIDGKEEGVHPLDAFLTWFDTNTNEIKRKRLTPDEMFKTSRTEQVAIDADKRREEERAKRKAERDEPHDPLGPCF